MLSILVDNDSWILPYAIDLEDWLRRRGEQVKLVRAASDIPDGEVCFLLGCTQVVASEFLSRNKHNLVVHESDLPRGRGFAPMAWQILEGKNDIPVCLVEASRGEPDAGPVWLRDVIHLQGQELNKEWRHIQGLKTLELCQRFLIEYEDLKPVPQVGKPSWYPRRTPKDSQLDPDKSLCEQINLLRIVDNERYPAYFMFGKRKILIRAE